MTEPEKTDMSALIREQALARNRQALLDQIFRPKPATNETEKDA